VRESVGWTDFQIKKHMNRLQDMEYVLVHRGGRGQSFVYELLYQGEGDDGGRFLLGLSNMENVNYDNEKKPLKTEKEPPSSPQVAAKLPPSSSTKNSVKLELSTDCTDEVLKAAKKGISLKNGAASHTTCRDALVSGEDRSPNRPHNSLAAQ